VSDDERSDTLDAQTPAEDESRTPYRAVGRIALAWRGPSKSKLINDPGKDVHPGDTLILRVSAGGWSLFGHIPDASSDPAAAGEQPSNDDDFARVDVGEQAYRQSRDRAILRLTPSRMKAWPADEAIDVLKDWVANPDHSLLKSALRDYLRLAADALQNDEPAIAQTLRLLANPKHGLNYQRYPDDVGVVLRNRRRIRAKGTLDVLPPMDDGDDVTTRTGQDEPISLLDHTRHVRDEVDASCRLLSIADSVASLQTAADLHDWGKADERFQALLVNGDLSYAWAQPTLWAKSASMPVTRTARRAARKRAGLPDNFRHEMLSLQFAQAGLDRLPGDATERDLVLHLIASHHGAARPFAPVVIDSDPPDVSLEAIGLRDALTPDQRRVNPPHRLDSGVAERFWTLNRRFGWWGLAYLEAILRLGDQRASELEDDMQPKVGAEPAGVTT
jgi:CRISPR-associated endonuclease/helicase Cas3